MGLLSWLTGRRRSGTGNTAHTGTETIASPQAPPATPGWREVPPLQRTVAAPELVTDPAGFRAGLGTWQNASFLGTLGHLVSPEAPSGVGHGLATPPTPPPADMPNPTRGTPPTVSRAVGPVAAREFGTPRSAPVQRAAEGAVTPDTREVEGAIAPDTPEVVEPLISARPPDEQIRQLTALPLTAPRARTEASDTPPATSPSPPSPPVQRSAAFGLGEPLSELPPTAQRRPAASTGALTPEEPGAAPPEPPRGDAPSRPLLPDDPLVVRTVDTAAAPGPTAAPASAAMPVPLQRSTATGTPIGAEPAPAAGPVVPLVAQRSVPLFSGVHEVPPTPGGSAPEPPVVPLRWSAADGPSAARPGVAATGAAPAAHRPATPTAQRSVAPGATAPPPPATRPLASAPATAPPRPARPLVDAGSVTVASGVAQRMADGSVVFQPPGVPPAPSPRGIQRARFLPPVQRDAETPEIPDIPDPPEPPQPPDPPEPPEPPPSGPSSGPAPGPSPGGAPHDGGPGGPGGHGEGGKGGAPKVDDELVRALYGPLSRLLKAELRLERERAGHLINTRH
ncbi:hypothetical protein [Streptomyces malaysiensis]|uniref:hypothetical protein n=1 Tax=Streptomyces malaysiensis TaxID=92644 RepID=UPI000BFC203C|nr:hypothetical protein [Streptomyces malaysiensis]